MCLSAQAFGMFLSLLSLNNVSVHEGLVVIHTPERDVLWRELSDAMWCTASPGEDRFAKLAGAAT